MQIKKILTLSSFILYNLFSYSQRNEVDYIKYYNYSNEAEYYFYREDYSIAISYFQCAFKLVESPYPLHHYLYSKALWKVDRHKSMKELKKDFMYSKSIVGRDSSWFSEMDSTTKNKLVKKLNQIAEHIELDRTYWDFVDSLLSLDQKVRSEKADLSDKLYYNLIGHQDSLNGEVLIEFAKRHGFPGGKNVLWNQKISVILLHMNKDWLIRNYYFLVSEVRKGNLEPWMLASVIDRNFALKDNDFLCLYNKYYIDSPIDPFIMFQNCVRLGVSPYFNNNWTMNPKKTIHYKVYHNNKSIYNTSYY